MTETILVLFVGFFLALPEFFRDAAPAPSLSHPPDPGDADAAEADVIDGPSPPAIPYLLSDDASDEDFLAHENADPGDVGADPAAHIYALNLGVKETAAETSKARRRMERRKQFYQKYKQ